MVLVILACGIFIGRQWMKSSMDPMPVNTVDTVEIRDTILHEIPVNHYFVDIDTVFFTDSILIPANIDTALILRDYYTTFKYERSWEDSLIKINFDDFISRNRITNSTPLKYELLKPQTIITNNITNYTNYISIGANTDFNLNFFNLDLTYTTSKFNYKLLYYPHQKAFGVGISYNFIKIKK
jgi:hypothetical protein